MYSLQCLFNKEIDHERFYENLERCGIKWTSYSIINDYNLRDNQNISGTMDRSNSLSVSSCIWCGYLRIFFRYVATSCSNW